jgi:outer membrane protein assembly factor BamB
LTEAAFFIGEDWFLPSVQIKLIIQLQAVRPKKQASRLYHGVADSGQTRHCRRIFDCPAWMNWSELMLFESCSFSCPGVVPVLVGPLQIIITILPGILLAILSGMIRLFSPTGFRNAMRLVWRQKAAVLALGLLVAGAVYGYRTFLRSDQGAVTDAEKGSDWTTARFDLKRTGAVPGAESPTAPKVIWNYRSEYGFLASPAVVGNRVYISAARLGVFEKSGQIFCFDADTGAVVWANSPENYRPTFSSPVIAGDYLVCGEGLHETYDARVVCLDIRPDQKGKVLWTFTTRNHVECTPAIYNDRVYFGAGDDGIYCLDLKPGDNKQAKLIWHIPNTMFVGSDGKQFKDKAAEYGLRNARFKEGVTVVFKSETKDGKIVPVVLRPLKADENAGQFADMSSGKIKTKDADKGILTVVTPKGEDLELTVSEFPDAETSLAVYDGKVYFGLGNDGRALSVIDADTGKELQRIDMGYPVFGPASIANGKIYLGMGEGDYVNASPDGKEGGSVKCVDLATLKIDWSFSPKKTVLGAVAVMDSKKGAAECKLYFGSCDGTLYCLSEKGELLGKYEVPGEAELKTSPAVTEKWVYIVTDKGLLIALDRKSLTPKWEYKLGPNQIFISSPVVARGHIYVGTQEDGFFCVGEVRTTPFWPNPLGGLDRTGNDDNSYFPEEMVEQWTYLPANSGNFNSIAASIACWKDELYVPVGGPQPSGGPLGGRKPGLACLSRKTVADPQPRWFFDIVGEIAQNPVVLEDSVLFTEHDKKLAAERLVCLDRTTGKFEWDRPIAASSPQARTGMLTVTTHQILVQDKKNYLTSLDLEGKVQWSHPIGAFFRGIDPPKGPTESTAGYVYPMAISNIIVAATPESAPELGLDRKPALVALDRGSGAVIWKVPLEGPPCTSPYAVKTTIYVGTPTGLEAHSLIDGKLLKGWDCQAGRPATEFVVDDKNMAYVNDAGELVVIRREDGSVKGSVRGNISTLPPLRSRDVYLVVTGQGLAQAAFSKGDDGKPQLKLESWAETNMLGPLSAPIVVSGSRLFVPTPQKGLICIGGKK